MHPLKYWLELIQFFIDGLGELCIAKDNTIIGHIKGIALLHKDGFISANKVSDQHPAELNVHNVNYNQEFNQMRFNITVLVYGIDSDELEVALDKAIVLMRYRFAVETSICDVY